MSRHSSLVPQSRTQQFLRTIRAVSFLAKTAATNKAALPVTMIAGPKSKIHDITYPLHSMYLLAA